jgi:hypothetical protein
MKDKNWVGVDLDGTLATYDDWKGVEHIGEPVPMMLMRVLFWIGVGRKVKIFTARVGGGQRDEALPYIEAWCLKHLGQVLDVTCEKDLYMIELWDDRAKQVEPNMGLRVDGVLDQYDANLLYSFCEDQEDFTALIEQGHEHASAVLHSLVTKKYLREQIEEIANGTES